MDVKISYSNKRLRTVSARLVGGDLLVSAPASIPRDRLEKIVTAFKARFERRKIREELNKERSLEKAAQLLNHKYFDGKLKINSIEYTAGQNSRFGCCNFKEGRILISHKLSRMPEWVRDYVIMHEMAHLLEPNHSRAFWDIVSRYKLAERARGYLMGAGVNSEEEEDFASR